MNRCPITYQPCETIYSPKGLKLLSRHLTGLSNLPFTGEELRREAAAQADKISIQGGTAKAIGPVECKKEAI